MTWRVRSFFVDSQLEEFLNSIDMSAEQITSMHSVVQGPRTGVRVVYWLHDDQLPAEEKWVAKMATARANRGSGPAPAG